MMELIRDWAAIAGMIISSATVIGIFVGPIRKFFRELGAIKSGLELQAAHSRDSYMAILRLAMYASELPLAERVNAGKKYLDGGGNGSAHIQHEENVAALRKERRK